MYGYFPAGRMATPFGCLMDGTRELRCFELPRQRSGNRYCIADFFNDLDAEGRPTDVLPMQAVTMGQKASVVAQELFKGDRYSDAVLPGLAVQMAEAMAEWVHAWFELGFADPDGIVLRDVLAQRYRGGRYSFGYTAPMWLIQGSSWVTKLREIGLNMDASDQLEPEQSTTALVRSTPKRVLQCLSLKGVP